MFLSALLPSGEGKQAALCVCLMGRGGLRKTCRGLCMFLSALLASLSLALFLSLAQSIDLSRALALFLSLKYLLVV
jgi:hypothetical protein